MEDVSFTPIHDDIISNILARLSGKCLLRFRCVSKHWNRLISDPNFMKWRSRRMILFSYTMPHVVIDPKDHSLFMIPSPLENGYNDLSVVGTHNGIVLLIIQNGSSKPSHMYLYNPLTRASKLLDVMDRPSPKPWSSYDFGFGYGSATDDLKIVRFGAFCDSRFTCDVFDIKTSSWGTSPIYLKKDFYFWYAGHVSINGYIYWIIVRPECVGILALNVKEMIFSNIDLPKSGQDPPLMHPFVDGRTGILLGSLNGCLCMIQKKHTGFEFWMMKKNLWSKEHSFTFDLEANYRYKKFRPMCILVNGKILLTDGRNQFVIYDTSKDSHITRLDNLIDHDDLLRRRMLNFLSIEYVESLVSPSDICAAV